MQDKNKLDDMAKKYKDEMMQLYSRNKTVLPSTAAAAAPVKKTAAVQESAAVPVKASVTAVPSEPIRDLSNPPMPQIPQNYGTGAPKTSTPQNIMPRNNVPRNNIPRNNAPQVTVPRNTPSRNTVSKFPTAEEILRAESGMVTPNAEARFVPVETDEHTQGNYDFPVSEPEPEEQFPTEETEFENVEHEEEFPEENPPDMTGQGYLQVEVTTGNGAVPVEGAMVIVTQKTDGMNSLVTMKLTDRNGTTEVIPLPAPSQSFSESPEPSERPFSEYNISVYKKGFYTIPQLTVPIFDTIKSIQPVAVIPLAEYELNGAVTPTKGANANG